MLTTIIKLPERTNKAAPSLKVKVLYRVFRTIFWWVPRASPGYDKKQDDVAYWLIEVENGRAEREIGFDAQDKPILHAPTDRDLGMWTDSDRVFIVAEYEIAAAQEFNCYWIELEKQEGI